MPALLRIVHVLYGISQPCRMLSMTAVVTHLLRALGFVRLGASLVYELEGGLIKDPTRNFCEAEMT